jgi:drug/metabolite transporter (DMT)-like permease
MIYSLILIGSGITIIGNSKIKSENDFLKKIREEVNTKVNDNNNISSSNIFKGILYGLFASLGWAIGLVMIDYALNQIVSILNLQRNSSIIGNVIRFPFALSILAIMVFREKIISKKDNKKINQKRSKETWLILTLASIIGTSLGAYLYTEAARIAGANILSLLATSSPLFALPLTYWINKEKITRFGFLGVILTISGVILILL